MNFKIPIEAWEDIMRKYRNEFESEKERLPARVIIEGEEETHEFKAVTRRLSYSADDTDRFGEIDLVNPNYSRFSLRFRSDSK